MLTFDTWNPHPQTIREMEDNRARWNNKQYEQFMRENADDLEWFYVCSKFCLYENFIREMKDYVDWGKLSTWKKMSDRFQDGLIQYSAIMELPLQL